MKKTENKKILTPPEWLDDTAKEEWNRVATELGKRKILSEGDVTAIELYCKSYSRWKEAEKQIDSVGSTVFKSGKGNYVQQLPQIAIAQKYMKICQDFLTEFGMTPSSRGKMRFLYNDD
ncbi:MAG TPA: phage terminase small subunit P27 family [Clostridiales bacterium]|nr:MAG: hypothetical protein A2Y22_08615 [Clostridiales bacterium GWD2_32_59]HAN09375.1 phage terminase small subunit P27 family [Clostridiales bacterium]